MTRILREKIGKVLKEARIKKNYKQSDISKLFKVDQSNISKWENGQGLYADIFLRLVFLYGCANEFLEKLITGNPYNKYCLDCKKAKSTHFLVWLGIFTCKKCADQHLMVS